MLSPRPLNSLPEGTVELSNTSLADLRGFILEEVVSDGLRFVELTHLATPLDASALRQLLASGDGY